MFRTKFAIGEAGGRGQEEEEEEEEGEAGGGVTAAILFPPIKSNWLTINQLRCNFNGPPQRQFETQTARIVI